MTAHSAAPLAGAHASALFSPLSLRSLTLRNRIMVSPMAQYCAEDGRPTDWHLVHLGKMAQSGAGLVCAEATKIEPRGMGTLGDTGLWRDDHEAAFRRIVDFVHAQGAAAAVQLNHAGRKAGTLRPWEGWGPLDRSIVHHSMPPEVIAPSALAYREGWPLPRAMTPADIADVIQAWTESVRRADRAGFDVVEIHAAHGYLIHQFLSPASNRRTDGYGGTLAGRMRFGLEVVEAARAAWPAAKPLFVRVSCTDEAGWTIEDTVAFAGELRRLGVDLVDCSSGGIQPKSHAAFETEVEPGYQVPFARRVRADAGIATAAVGLITEPGHAESILRNGDADLVAIGRELLSDPSWPARARAELVAESAFEQLPPQYGWWLKRRNETLGERRARYAPAR
jgi:2,4-dienoyl-CoA reductase-like NADH-dependent reductase (Old Yellow Enzyme family)